MSPGQVRPSVPFSILLLIAALLIAGSGAQATLSSGTIGNLATGPLRSIPNPVSEALGSQDQGDDPVTNHDATDEPDPQATEDEPLDRHEAQADDGPDLATLLGWAAWAAPAGAFLIAGVAMARLRARPAEKPTHQGPTEPERREGRTDGDEPPPDPDPAASAFLDDPPPPGVDGVLEIAQANVDRGDFEAAARWFETAIALRPRLTVAHFCLGLTLEQLGRDEEALEAFRAADELGGPGVAPTYRQARILARMDRRRDALTLLSKVLAEEPQLRDDAAEDPVFERLKDHPRFLAMLGQL